MVTNSTSTAGLSSNVSAALSYLLGFITGIVFLLISKDKFVRFHAMQSIIVSLGFFVLNLVLNNVPGVGGSLSSLVSLASLILMIVLIVKAYQGVKFKLPVIGDIAENQVK